MPQTFFTSDTHFGHKNILVYDKRPFTNIEEHDQTILKNWNSVVHKDDTIYFLGDFSLSFKKNVDYDRYLMMSLKGKKFFIKGNHDHDQNVKLFKEHGTYLGKLEEININGQQITICHYAMKVWRESHYGSWQLYGHSHGSLSDDPHSLSIDVGINVHNFFPIEFNEIKQIMSKKKFVAVDHHQSKI
jgi:calcineurin-like phosphoesterase family protein